MAIRFGKVTNGINGVDSKGSVAADFGASDTGGPLQVATLFDRHALARVSAPSTEASVPTLGKFSAPPLGVDPAAWRRSIERKFGAPSTAGASARFGADDKGGDPDAAYSDPKDPDVKEMADELEPDMEAEKGYSKRQVAEYTAMVMLNQFASSLEAPDPTEQTEYEKQMEAWEHENSGM